MPKERDDMVYRLADGGIILDTNKFISFVGKHGDRTYHWVLESGELPPLRLAGAAVFRAALLGALAFFLPYSVLTYWTWRPAQVAFMLAIVTFLGLAIVMRLRGSWLRSRGANLVRRVGSVQRMTDWAGAKYLTICAGLLAALMFAPEWFIRDGFNFDDGGFWTPLPFLSFQVARVFSLDTIEIAGWNWSSVATASRPSIGATVVLNILISVGAVKLVLQAVREASSRAETVVGDTFDMYRLLRHEPFLGGKWVVVHGFVSDVEERAITGFEFVKAYENGLIPNPVPPDYGEPSL